LSVVKLLNLCVALSVSQKGLDVGGVVLIAKAGQLLLNTSADIAHHGKIYMRQRKCWLDKHCFCLSPSLLAFFLPSLEGCRAFSTFFLLLFLAKQEKKTL
jgi:hypothetical protein